MATRSRAALSSQRCSTRAASTVLAGCAAAHTERPAGLGTRDRHRHKDEDACGDVQRLDPALFAEGELDRANARDVEARRGRPIEELIAEIESDGQVRDELMSKLTDADCDLRQKEFPLSLGEVLEVYPDGHDREHLEQLRAALKEQALTTSAWGFPPT